MPESDLNVKSNLVIERYFILFTAVKRIQNQRRFRCLRQNCFKENVQCFFFLQEDVTRAARERGT